MFSIIESFQSKSGKHKSDLHKGLLVKIVKKKNQRSGKLTTGKIDKILTNSNFHSRGLKVMFKDGTVGRVQQILM